MKKIAFFAGLSCLIFAGVSFASANVSQSPTPAYPLTCHVSSSSSFCTKTINEIQNSCKEHIGNNPECNICGPNGIGPQIYGTNPVYLNPTPAQWLTKIEAYCSGQAKTQEAECVATFSLLINGFNCISFSNT